MGDEIKNNEYYLKKFGWKKIYKKDDFNYDYPVWINPVGKEFLKEPDFIGSVDVIIEECRCRKLHATIFEDTFEQMAERGEERWKSRVDNQNIYFEGPSPALALCIALDNYLGN